MAPEITPTDATLGAVVSNVRLNALDDAAFAAILEAWHAHAVLIFPGQYLSEEEQVAFSRRFGPLERSLTKTHTKHDPAIIHLSNVKKDGSLWEAKSDTGRLLQGNNYWHTDSSYKRIPAKASLLVAKVVPKSGGETAFADMRAAYDALDPAMRAWLADKIAVHSYAYSQGKVGGTGAITRDEWDALPPVEQPVIRTHPATGRRNLYIGRHASHIVGEDPDESRKLLEGLCTAACQAPRIHVHKWDVGDLVIWDNRCVLHRGLGHPLDQPRRMVRTTVAGDSDEANEWVA
ncbi:MAG: TauD/TfdA family dioxygenase [Rhodospirillales bacterium]|nr:TauD/TfdA family dioxygenase [Rhodospirillales bacterium]MDE0379471.1 TauD/TfdA family dioxygenase [Rhodospirillales bacterium]